MRPHSIPIVGADTNRVSGNDEMVSRTALDIVDVIDMHVAHVDFGHHTSRQSLDDADSNVEPRVSPYVQVWLNVSGFFPTHHG